MSAKSLSTKAQQWLERFRRFYKSELTVLQFCQSEGVSQPSFYHWKRKLSSRLPDFPRRKRAPSSFRTGQRLAAFQAVKLVSSGPVPSPGALTIDLPSGIQIQVAAEESVVQLVLEKLLPAQTLNGALNGAKTLC